MKKALVILITSLTLSHFSYAELPSYSYIQLGNSKMQFDDLDIDLEGYEIKGKLSLSDNFYFNYEKTSMDARGVEVEIKDIGLGYRSMISSETDLFVQLDRSYYELDARFRTFDRDEDGYRASIGIRHMITDKLEFKVAYQYLDINETTSDIYVIGVDYQLTENLSLYADYKDEADFDHLGLGVRFKF